MKKIIISVIIIAKNEAAMIGDCLQSAAWADELILVDNGSTDQTVEFARRHGARVLAMPTPKPAFSQLRNLGLEKARGHWLLYLDADERITPELKKEVRKVISQKLSAKSYSDWLHGWFGTGQAPSLHPDPAQKPAAPSQGVQNDFRVGG